MILTASSEESPTTGRQDEREGNRYRTGGGVPLSGI